MNTYRFVGSACEIGGVNYDQFGQRAQFTAQQAKDVLLGGGAFISEADFAALNVTQEEIDTYGFMGGFPEPTEAFAKKRDRAHVRVREVIAQYNATGHVEAPVADVQSFEVEGK
jgi:hypothetical protein